MHPLHYPRGARKSKWNKVNTKWIALVLPVPLLVARLLLPHLLLDTCGWASAGSATRLRLG
jgi:hypothetical protein